MNRENRRFVKNGSILWKNIAPYLLCISLRYMEGRRGPHDGF